MALALVLQDIDQTRRRTWRTYKVTLSGSYVTGGDTMDFTAQTNPFNFPSPKWARKPDIYSVEHLPAGYNAEVVPGAGLNNWKLKFFTASGTELAAAGYPGALSGSTTIRVAFSGPQMV